MELHVLYDYAARHQRHHWDLEDGVSSPLSSMIDEDAGCGSMLAPGTNRGAARNVLRADLNALPLESLKMDVQIRRFPVRGNWSRGPKREFLMREAPSSTPYFSLSMDAARVVPREIVW
jgi:hypothetical protein